MVIPNALAQNRSMSYTARGLLVDLLSRPDDWRETCRQMADSSPQGRKALAAALEELRVWGYYRVDVVQLPNGRIRSEAHVYDRPQLGVLPGATVPDSGESDPAQRGVLPNDLVEIPSLPGPEPESVAEGGKEESASDLRPRPLLSKSVPEMDTETRTAMAALLRAVRPERRLPLGEAEAAALAPMVRAWMDRGGSEEQLREALLSGLPQVVYSPAAVLRSRLERKMPAELPSETRRRRGAECAECRDPLSEPGLCVQCRGAVPRQEGADRGVEVTARGIAKVRAAMGR
ncbi:hypothetical protein AB0E96_01180 [Kitasatospora sp. NPDC036755]|uniref:hypothetical protein n=1 Tax=Kitasatospora sp. NPDC036755 TaxID=3154600 RepID=UPI003402F374